MANPGLTGPIPDLSMDDARKVSTKRSLNRQADAKAGTDQAFDAFAAYVMSHHFFLAGLLARPVWRQPGHESHVRDHVGSTKALLP
jgi:hypothetical protein